MGQAEEFVVVALIEGKHPIEMVVEALTCHGKAGTWGLEEFATGDPPAPAMAAYRGIK